MTVNEQSPIAQYTGDGVVAAFGFPFQVFNLADVVVSLRDDNGVAQTIAVNGSGTYDYTVTGTFDPTNNRWTNGVTVTFNTAPLASWDIGITRDSVLEQALDLVAGGGFNPDSVEFQLDKIVHMIQEVRETLSRTYTRDIASGVLTEDLVFDGIARVTGLPLAAGSGDAVPFQQLSQLASQGSLAFNGWLQTPATGAGGATSGQTTVDLSTAAPDWVPGSGTLLVFVNGVYQSGGYTENANQSITFSEGLAAGDQVSVLLLGTSDLASVATSIYDVAFTYQGVPGSSAELVITIPRNCELLAGALNSVGGAEVAATASADFDLQKNNVSIGTVNFAAAATTATFTVAATTSFAAGDRISIVAPATADATLADIGITLVLRIT